MHELPQNRGSGDSGEGEEGFLIGQNLQKAMTWMRITGVEVEEPVA